MNLQGITNKDLAAHLHRFADGFNVHSDYYFSAVNHALATGNDRDAMQRIIYGRRLPDDGQRVHDLARQIEAQNDQA
jgi:hypothetical protein